MEKVSTILLVCCIVASLFSAFYSRRPVFLRSFPVYFLVAFLVQTYGEYLGRHNRTNIPLYNIYSTLEFAFFFFVLRFMIQGRVFRAILLILVFAFPILSFLNLHLIQGNTVFLTMSYGLGCLMVAFFCIIYFVELFQMPKAIALQTSPAFWICTATLFNYTGTLPFWGLVNSLSISESNYTKAADMVIVINILTYILYIIAFLCRIKIRKSIS